MAEQGACDDDDDVTDGSRASAPARKRLLLFDICEHAYTHPCFELLQNNYSAVDMELVAGDSRETLPAYKEGAVFQDKVPGELAAADKFALIHVDGGHSRDVVCVTMPP